MYGGIDGTKSPISTSTAVVVLWLMAIFLIVDARHASYLHTVDLTCFFKVSSSSFMLDVGRLVYNGGALGGCWRGTVVVLVCGCIDGVVDVIGVVCCVPWYGELVGAIPPVALVLVCDGILVVVGGWVL